MLHTPDRVWDISSSCHLVSIWRIPSLSYPGLSVSFSGFFQSLLPLINCAKKSGTLLQDLSRLARLFVLVPIVALIAGIVVFPSFAFSRFICSCRSLLVMISSFFLSISVTYLSALSYKPSVVFTIADHTIIRLHFLILLRNCWPRASLYRLHKVPAFLNHHQLSSVCKWL